MGGWGSAAWPAVSCIGTAGEAPNSPLAGMAVMMMGHVRLVPLLWCAAVALLVRVDRAVAEDSEVDIDSMMEYIVNSSTTSGTPAVECGSASEVERELCKSLLCACVLLCARRLSRPC